MGQSQAALRSAVERLERLYAELPVLDCLGLCEDSCHTHVDASTTERRQLLAAGVDLDQPTHDGACPALSHTFGAGRCSVYAIRPTICRLWGVADAMRCPHGCTPAGGHVDDGQAMRWMLTSLRLGGHPEIGPDVARLLERCLADPTAASLFARFLRGDKTVAPELYERMVSLRP